MTIEDGLPEDCFTVTSEGGQHFVVAPSGRRVRSWRGDAGEAHALVDAAEENRRLASLAGLLDVPLTMLADALVQADRAVRESIGWTGSAPAQLTLSD